MLLSFFVAERLRMRADDQSVARVRRWSIAACVLVLPFLFFRTYVVSANSMEPTLLPGDVVVTLSVPFVKTPNRGEVWVVRDHDRVLVPLIKRVKWVAGDTVRREDAGVVDASGPAFGDGSEVKPKKNERAKKVEAEPARKVGTVVPDGAVYVIGDNRVFSVDSRQFGHVEEEHLVARVVAVVFSYGGQEGSDAFGKSSVRWNRIGSIVR